MRAFPACPRRSPRDHGWFATQESSRSSTYSPFGGAIRTRTNIVRGATGVMLPRESGLSEVQHGADRLFIPGEEVPDRGDRGSR